MSNNSATVGDQIRSGLKGIRGVGDAIRGTAMSTADDVFNTHDNTGRNEAITERGVADMKNADNTVGKDTPGHNANTTTAHAQGATGQTVTTDAGAHSSTVGNLGSTGPTTTTAGTTQESLGGSQRY